MLIAVFFVFDLGNYLTLESLKANRDALTTFYQRNRTVMAAAFIAAYIIQSGDDHQHERGRFAQLLGSITLLGLFVNVPVLYHKFNQRQGGALIDEDRYRI